MNCFILIIVLLKPYQGLAAGKENTSFIDNDYTETGKPLKEKVPPSNLGVIHHQPSDSGKNRPVLDDEKKNLTEEDRRLSGDTQQHTHTVTISKYVFNNSPTEQEQQRLNFMRNAMRAVLGEIRFCDTSVSTAKTVNQSLCVERCSCHVTCHDSRNCCPDIQHKLISITTPLLDEMEKDKRPYQVCQTLHNAMYKHLSKIVSTSVTQQTSLSQNVDKKDNRGTMSDKEHDRAKFATLSPPKYEDNVASETVPMRNDDKTETESKHNKVFRSGQIQDTSETKSMDNNISESGLNPDKYLKTNDIESDLNYPKYRVISKCPITFTNQTVIEKCEDPGPLVQDMITAVDEYTGLVYRNIHCGACHNISSLSLWDITSDCLKLYTINCPLLTQNLRQITVDGNCKILFTPPLSVDISTEECSMDDSTEGKVISTCNVTGLLGEDDETVQELCIHPHMEVHFYAMGGPDLLVYRNVFCYICNKAIESQPKTSCHNRTERNRKDTDAFFPNLKLTIPAEAILTAPEYSVSCGVINDSEVGALNLNGSQNSDACQLDEFWDVYVNKCRQLVCPINRFSLHLFCVPKQMVVQGLIFDIQLAVTVEKDRFIDTRLFMSVFKNIYNDVDSYIGLSLFKCVTKHVEALAKANNGQMHFFVLKLKVANSKYCTIENLFQILDKTTTLKTLPTHRLLNIYNFPQLQIQVEFRNLSESDINFKEILFTSPSGNTPEIILKPLYNCPKTKLSEAEYNLSIKENTILQDLDFNEVHFSEETHTFEICLVSYIKKWLLTKLKSHEQTPERSKQDENESTLSAIASMTSIISTVIVLITYILFSELRFVPGKLFMILCVNLLLAQLVFAFSKNEGYNEYVCKCIGIAVHYFWLATFFSMTSCLFLMIRSIKNPMEQTNRILMNSKSISKASQYILFTYISPSLIVSITLLYAWLTSQPYGGYGGEICYISTQTLRICMFAIPIGIMITLNFTMFAMIFTTLTCLMKANNKGNQQYIVTFLKLSTITGMFWAFGFLYEATDIYAFECLFTVLNAGQGFFLMWSFIVNKRVMHLYIAHTKDYFHRLQEWTVLGGTST